MHITVTTAYRTPSKNTRTRNSTAVTSSSGARGMAKPDAAIFTHVAARLELAVDELVMIGDSRHDDVRGAESAGMHALHLDRRGRGKRGSLRSLEEMFEQPVFEAR